MQAMPREGEFEIVSLNVSEKKGTRKRPIPLARFAVGHTPEVAARHYADLPSLRPLHEATIAKALS